MQFGFSSKQIGVKLDWSKLECYVNILQFSKGWLTQPSADGDGKIGSGSERLTRQIFLSIENVHIMQHKSQVLRAM